MPRVKGVNLTKDQRRDLILQAGLVTFCRMGYDGTNIDDIAKESKCSHGLIYYYFKNKEEIFRELVKISTAAAQEMSNELAKDASLAPPERLRNITAKLLATIETNQNVFYFFQFTTMLKLLKKNLSFLEIEQPKYLPYETARDIIRQGQEDGSFREGNPDAYANLYLAILQGLTNRKAFASTGNYPAFSMPTVDMILALFIKE